MANTCFALKAANVFGAMLLFGTALGTASFMWVDGTPHAQRGGDCAHGACGWPAFLSVIAILAPMVWKP